MEIDSRRNSAASAATKDLAVLRPVSHHVCARAWGGLMASL